MTDPRNGTTYRLDDLSRRVEAIDRDQRETTKSFRDRFHGVSAEVSAVTLLCNQIPALDRRVAKLEEANFALLNEKLDNLDKRVNSLARGWTALTGGIVLAVIVFALSVASGQI